METVPLKEAQSMVGTIGELFSDTVALNRRIKFKEQKIELMEKLIEAWNKELDAYRVWISNGKLNVHPVNEAIENRQIAQANYQRKIQEEQLEGIHIMKESPMTIIARINYLSSKAVLNHPTVNLGKPSLNIYMGKNIAAQLKDQLEDQLETLDSIDELELIRSGRDFKIMDDRLYYDNNPVYLVDEDTHLNVSVKS